MTERDPRWERVGGGMTRWTLPGDNTPAAARIDIEVIDPAGHRVSQTIIVTDEMREFAIVDPVPHVLDQMVRKLDEVLHA